MTQARLGSDTIVRVLARQPNRSFTTTRLVEELHPAELEKIREHLQYGSAQHQRAAQNLKSALHRRTLHHINRLIAHGVLKVMRTEAHGERVYQLAAPTVHAHTQAGPVVLTQQSPHIHRIEAAVESKMAFFSHEGTLLSRVDALYLDCRKLEGIGILTRMLSAGLRAVHDVVCIDHFQVMIARYNGTDIADFLRSAQVEALNESRTVCLRLDCDSHDCTAFLRQYSATLPKRIQLILAASSSTLQADSFAQYLQLLQDRHERIYVSNNSVRQSPLFVGSFGMYGFGVAEWHLYEEEMNDLPGCVLSQATIALDMQRLEKLPIHDQRSIFVCAAQTLHALANQQRFAGTALEQLRVLHCQPERLFLNAQTTLRVWNYNWNVDQTLLEMLSTELPARNKMQEHIFLACGLPTHCAIQLSSCFQKFHKELSARQYVKRSLQTSKELSNDHFKDYLAKRLRIAKAFGGVERLRIFRSGNPRCTDIAAEISQLTLAGFACASIDFQPLQGVRRLTEYLQ